MSDNGYVRLQFDQLKGAPLVHLASGLDEDGPDDMGNSAVATAITGYTEWICNGNLIITIGWDWQMLSDEQTILLRRVGEPSSNLMLQDANGGDLGPIKTANLLATFVDGFNWQSETLQYINVRYKN